MCIYVRAHVCTHIFTFLCDMFIHMCDTTYSCMCNVSFTSQILCVLRFCSMCFAKPKPTP